MAILRVADTLMEFQIAWNCLFMNINLIQGNGLVKMKITANQNKREIGQKRLHSNDRSSGGFFSLLKRRIENEKSEK